MKVCIHRGSNQIGGSCVEIEQEGQRILLDIGLPLDAESNDESLLPQVRGLDGSDPSLLGIFLSHMHLDHTGLLKHLPSDTKVGLGPAARRIIEAALPFLSDKFPSIPKGWNYEPWQTFEVGPFNITPYLVDHSAYDSYSLLIEAGGKRLLYSGDFRGHGRKAKLFENMLKRPPKNIDILLMEGSALGRLDQEGSFPTEDDIEQQLTTALSNTKGLAMVHTSIQNIDRLVSIMRASKKTDRKLVIDLYAAAVLHATKNKNIPQSHWKDIVLFVPYLQSKIIKTNRWFDQLRLHSSNRIFIEHIKENPRGYTMLFRPPCMLDLSKSNCLDGASYIYSQWEGYWERGTYDRVKSWLTQNGLERQSIHTSGHAGPADLKKYVQAIKPERLVPIHSFMPESYSHLYGNVEFRQDGEWWEV